MPNPSPTRTLRLAWFACGFVAVVSTILLALNWSSLVEWLTERPFVRESQPPVLKGIQSAVTYLPWIIGAAILAFRLKGRREARVLAYALGAVAAYLVLTAGVLARPVIDQWRFGTRFLPDAWRANARTSNVRWPIRLRMIDDLTGRRLLDTLDRTGVGTLLGPADSTSYFNDWDLVYWLGPERGLLSLDSEWLVVRFDTAGRVLEYRVVRD